MIYSLKISAKARRVRITIRPKTGAVLTVPTGFDIGEAKKFLFSKSAWVLKKLAKLHKYENQPVLKTSKKEFLEKKQAAWVLANTKVNEWNLKFGFEYKAIRIKNSKTRWGSCSRKGNLNFHYKIVDLPENLLDYLVVHELCHLKEMNHSAKFWQLVFREISDYKICRKKLKTFSL